jgi:hypothetical protein
LNIYNTSSNNRSITTREEVPQNFKTLNVRKKDHPAGSHVVIPQKKGEPAIGDSYPTISFSDKASEDLIKGGSISCDMCKYFSKKEWCTYCG